MCVQTVTVYHREGKDEITRTVIDRAFLDESKALNVARTGSSESSSFLLVVPGGEQACAEGDRVVRGEGPEVTTDEQWRELIPTKVPGVVVVRHVDVKRGRDGRVTHTEAGG